MDQAPSAQALTALAVVMSLVVALVKRGVIDQTALDATLKDAGIYAQALCVDCSREMEREVKRLLGEIGTTATQTAATETPPIPLVDPTQGK
jgi:hypothetical protein